MVSGVARTGRLGNAADGETSTTQPRQEVVGGLLAVEALLELGLELLAIYDKMRCYAELCTTRKVANLALTLHKQADRWALHTAS